MRIHRLSTTHYRNLVHEPIEFTAGVNVFVGPNGHGKTNVLEAIHFFKFGRSFRTARDTELIRFEEAFCRAEVQLSYATGDSESFAVSVERNGSKRVKIGEKETARLSDLVGRYPCVIFGPHDLELTSGAPAERRRYLDMTGSMTDPSYLEGLRGYRRVVAQRNAALKGGQASKALGVWAEELMRLGCALVERRVDLVAALRAHIRRHAAALGLPYEVDFSYESELTAGRPEEVRCEEHFAARLAAVESEEVRRKTTLVGPHRDDLKLVADGRDLRKFGSQGQRRLVAVLLRLSELSYLEERLQEPCVLLLDDLFSELDDTVSQRLRTHLDGEHQIFVTTPVDANWDDVGSHRKFNVRDGNVEVSA